MAMAEREAVNACVVVDRLRTCVVVRIGETAVAVGGCPADATGRGAYELEAEALAEKLRESIWTTLSAFGQHSDSENGRTNGN